MVIGRVQNNVNSASVIAKEEIDKRTNLKMSELGNDKFDVSLEEEKDAVNEKELEKGEPKEEAERVEEGEEKKKKKRLRKREKKKRKEMRKERMEKKKREMEKEKSNHKYQKRKEKMRKKKKWIQKKSMTWNLRSCCSIKWIVMWEVGIRYAIHFPCVGLLKNVTITKKYGVQ
jgi:hypothetical protein